jgi:hypothetical protein
VKAFEDIALASILEVVSKPEPGVEIDFRKSLDVGVDFIATNEDWLT